MGRRKTLTGSENPGLENGEDSQNTENREESSGAGETFLKFESELEEEPVSASDVANAFSFEESDALLEEHILGGVDPYSLKIELRKPPADRYITLSPEPRHTFLMRTMKGSGLDELYLITKSIYESYLRLDPRNEAMCSVKRFVLYATISEGELESFGIWPMVVPSPDGKLSKMQGAYLDMFKAGTSGEFFRAVWVPKMNCHSMVRLPDGSKRPEIIWPEKPMTELLPEAVGSSVVIAHKNHPKLKELRGE